MAVLTRQYLNHGLGRLHVRRAEPANNGFGGLVVLLHPVPGSSATLEPLLTLLAKHMTVIAPDLPGFGDTAGLGIDDPAIADYRAALVGIFDVLGVDRADVYGVGATAVLALDLVAHYPSRVRRIVLDDLPLLTRGERDEFVAEATPSLAATWDGSHLVRAWMMIRDSFTFRPWFKRSPTHRILRDFPSLPELESRFFDLLRAGPSYGQLEQAGFRYDVTSAVQRLDHPTLLMTSAVVEPESLPSSVQRQTSPGDVSAIVDFLTRPTDDRVSTPPRPADSAWGPSTISLGFTPTSVGPVLTRRSGIAVGRPLVLLHSSPGTSASLEPWMTLLGASRPVIAFDTPGNGDSAPVPGEPEIRDLAVVLVEAIDHLGLGEFDIYGSHTGALIAMEVAIVQPSRVGHAILDGITMFSPEETEEALAFHAPPMPSGVDGGFVPWAWNYIRDRSLWWHWYNRTAEGASAPRVRAPFPSPETLHTRVVEFLKGGRTYHLVYRAALSYPTRDRLPLITVPTFLCAGAADPLNEGLAEASQILPQAAMRILPGPSTSGHRDVAADWFRRFLADEPLP